MRVISRSLVRHSGFVRSHIVRITMAVQILMFYFFYFEQKGGKWKNWRVRYFVLKDNMLYYFSSPNVNLLLLLTTPLMKI